MKSWWILALCIVFTAIGMSGGWFAARQTGGGAGSDPLDDRPPADDRLELPPTTLENLGVKVGEARPTTFVRYRSIPAIVQRKPSSEQPVFAPIGGRVATVDVEPGVVVRPGDTLVTLVRDPIPRPTLTLTESILKPAQEGIHSTVVDLRKALDEQRIAETELERVEKFTQKVGDEELPVLPRQRAIDLRYQLLRATRSSEQARLELAKHGLSDGQIDDIAAGGAIPNLTADNWKRALRANGLWPVAAERLFETLPESLQTLPWVLATVGELTASGLNGPELIAWLETVPEDCEHFLDVAALLQKGHSVADLKRLHAQNAFDPMVRIQAPEGAPDWNVDELRTRPGAQVPAGSVLLSLLDSREVYLRLSPVGAEQSDVLKALAEESACVAVPLVERSGPHLEDLHLSFVTGDPDRGEGTMAYAHVTNVPLAQTTIATGRLHRSWKLREGLRYLFQVPTTRLENVYVLPSDAVTADGPHSIVFVQDGAHFRAVKVEIAYQDEAVVVIPSNERTEIFPGDPIVTHGAFGLGLALKSGSSKPDPHAGHQH